jgi:Leucine-rich repeat (LRR) protein
VSHLYLGTNQLTGNIPTELGIMSKLRMLFLEYNQLSGNIPAELGNLSNLAGLNLKGNPQLDKTTIPVEVQQLCDTYGKRCIFFG